MQGATPFEVIGAIRQKDGLVGSAFGVAAVWAGTLRVGSEEEHEYYRSSCERDERRGKMSQSTGEAKRAGSGGR